MIVERLVLCGAVIERCAFAGFLVHNAVRVHARTEGAPVFAAQAWLLHTPQACNPVQHAPVISRPTALELAQQRVSSNFCQWARVHNAGGSGSLLAGSAAVCKVHVEMRRRALVAEEHDDAISYLTMDDGPLHEWQSIVPVTHLVMTIVCGAACATA